MADHPAVTGERRRVDLVVFDCDGVLVDSERISVRVGTQVLRELGWPLTETEFAERFVGCSQEHFDREVSAGVGRPLGEGWERPYAQRYRDAFDAELSAVPGIEAVLDHLDREGVPYCVASNSGRAHVERSLRRSGLGARFTGRVFSAHDVARGKPAPDVYLHAARGMGVAPDRCAAVEDSPYGVAAAQAAGMTCLAYAGGVVPAARLSGLGAHVFSAMAELPSLLLAAAHGRLRSRAAAYDTPR